MAKCDRCGKEQKSLNDLTLYKARKRNMYTTSNSYEFEVCDECMRDLFAWIGGAPTEQAQQTRPDRVACPKCGTKMADISK